MYSLSDLLSIAGRVEVSGAPEGLDALLLGDLALAVPGRPVLHVARDDARLARLIEALRFFHPRLEVLALPAWDCLPYDRVSPSPDLVSRRIDSLTRLATSLPGAPGRIVVTTVSAVLQRLPKRPVLANAVRELKLGDQVRVEGLVTYLQHNGYRRAETVREAGEYALRGGILDVFPTGTEEPLRLDFFGDELEGIRSFDPLSQLTTAKRERLSFKPMSEVMLDPDSIQRFRSGYRAAFGADTADPLYEAVSAGRQHAGMEHWLPLFHDRLETVFDYLDQARVTLDHQVDLAIAARFETIAEYYAARRSMSRVTEEDGGTLYRPLPPERLYLTAQEWQDRLLERPVAALSPFAGGGDGLQRADAGGKPGQDFADVRAQPDANVYEAVREAIEGLGRAGQRAVVAAYTEGSADRLKHLLAEHGLNKLERAPDWSAVAALPAGTAGLVVLGLERGFATDGLAVLAESDILGERLSRPSRRGRRGEAFIREASTLAEGDLVVHIEHGIGRYDGLVTLDVSGAPHDCLRLLYAGGDKLFVPVENIEVLSRYGSEDADAQLDRLGGAAWQARKARVKQRVRDMADRLMRIAAERELKQGETVSKPDGLYEEFSARFPYAETDDQLRAIEEVEIDLSSGRPMDRLVCGDVGFGKTEVALRAAFLALMAGMQVAVVVPTTLLCRQHFRTFSERFKSLPVRIGQLSRLVASKEAAETKKGVSDGRVEMVIGTHALLAKSMRFANLGLLVVDEEQHFGVAQKERLKELKANVHVLTLTATPIPRTLQMALSGVREMSVIATPPVDRLAVRTFVLPYDPVIVREAIMREHFRGGQTFYVCPRIEDMPRVLERLEKLVPEVKVATAHGKLSPRALENVMSRFYDREFDILLSTNIVESGLDIPSANTLIVHRSDMFGLAQLYQLRGRVGRAKIRAYSYLTLPPNKLLTPSALKRLEVMQTLDTLGAGFSLASHDLDIRGAGNLLGEEQSGHIREVGIELYQQLLEEAVAAARGGETLAEADSWTPQITLGTPVLIPESYVADLSVRLGLYRRIATLVDQAEIDAFAAEMIDRFGKLPDEVENLLRIIAIKRLCRSAGVEKVEAGPKGAVVSFRNNRFAKPEALVKYISRQAGTVKVRPDQKLVFQRGWDTDQARVQGLHRLMSELVKLAA
ncbi:MAG: transcription-repair coupling factor [Proteobacteria bacterium]|nr:transcription-repair coupling factor [Pseudomonadota bacterium]MBI3498843.1 transcription-repair coupling factor [Pseudomonadota bacterium]